MKKIYITQNQLNKLINEDFDIEPFANAGGDLTKPLKASFTTVPRKIQGGSSPEKYNKGFYSTNANSIVRYVDFGNGDFVINPVSKTLRLSDNSQLRAWALGPLKNADYNHAIKKNQLSKYGNPVDWGDDKDKFLSYCAKYFAIMIPQVCKIENIQVSNVKYIAWPYSSSSFNSDFVRNFLVPALNSVGIEINESGIIPNIVKKENNAIKINIELAKTLGCDDIDIKTMMLFISEQQQMQNILVTRQKIDDELAKIEDSLSLNKTEEFYQYTTDNKRKEKDARSKRYRTNNGLYLNPDGRTRKWKGSDDKQTVDIQKGHVKDSFDIDRNVNSIADILLSHKEKVIDYYNQTEQKQKDIVNKDTITYNGKNYNLKDFGHFNANVEGMNNVHQNGGHTGSNFLDATVDKNGKAKKNANWEIKNQCEAYRRVLTDLFKVNDEYKSIWQNFDKSKTLIIFDDNIAGGSTLAKTCDALMKGPSNDNWKSIIPISISLMQMSQGMNDLQIVKQSQFRDPLAADNGAYDGLKSMNADNQNSITFWSMDTRRGDEGLTSDEASRADMASVYGSMAGSETFQSSKTPTIIDGDGQHVTVCSLEGFKNLCTKMGVTDENVENKFKNYVFIEIGSTLARLQLDMGFTRDYDARKYKGENGRLNAARDFYNNGRFYFKSNHSNVLRLEFDDNMVIGSGRNGETPVVVKGAELSKNFPDYKKYKNKTLKRSYSNAIGFSYVQEETFNFIEQKINELGNDIQFIIHCEQGASRSAALGYYISKRLGDNIENFLKRHSTFDKNGNIKKTQFRMGKSFDKDGKEQYSTMHNTIFKGLGNMYNQEYGARAGLGSDRDIKSFVDKYKIVNENCDYVFSDKGEQCNANQYGFPFIFFNDRLYCSNQHGGHGVFANNLIAQGEVDAKEKENGINNRHISITGRVFPKVYGGKSIITFWNIKAHDLYGNVLKNTKILEKIANGISKFYNISISDMLIELTTSKKKQRTEVQPLTDFLEGRGNIDKAVEHSMDDELMASAINDLSYNPKYNKEEIKKLNDLYSSPRYKEYMRQYLQNGGDMAGWHTLTSMNEDKKARKAAIIERIINEKICLKNI